MRKIKSLLVVAATCLLVACAAGHVSSSELNALQRGMSSAAVAQVISGSPSQTLSMVVHHQPISVQVYGMGPQADFLAYKHDHLLYWGTASQFASSSDPLVRAIGRRTVSDLGVSATASNPSHSGGY